MINTVAMHTDFLAACEYWHSVNMYEESKYLTSRPYLLCCRHLLILKKKQHFFFSPGFTNNIFLPGSSVSFFSPLTDTNYNSQRRRMFRRRRRMYRRKETLVEKLGVCEFLVTGWGEHKHKITVGETT